MRRAAAELVANFGKFATQTVLAETPGAMPLLGGAKGVKKAAR